MRNACVCESMVVRCMDFRFHAELPQLLAEHFNVDCFEYDSPGGCGGSKSLIEEPARSMILETLELAVELHGVRRLIVVDHIDCGAWGGSEAFDGEDAEREFHVERLMEAREIVRQRHPDLEIVLFYQDWDGISPIE